MFKQFNSIPAEVYHGTSSDNYHSLREGINLNPAKANQTPDFGKGFYTTENYKQAFHQAQRKADKHNRRQNRIVKEKKGYTPQYAEPIVLNYKVDTEKLSALQAKLPNNAPHCVFNEPNNKWGEFVVNNRVPDKAISDFHNQDQRYHYVYGPLADGFTHTLIADYFKSEISWNELMRGITPQKNGIYYPSQLSIHTLEALGCLTLKEGR